MDLLREGWNILVGLLAITIFPYLGNELISKKRKEKKLLSFLKLFFCDKFKICSKARIIRKSLN